MGFTGTDIADITDRLAYELIIWGDLDTITARVCQQLHAGADHVMLHVLSHARACCPGGRSGRPPLTV
jgi:hypothetical protein